MADLASHVGQWVRIHTPDWIADGTLRRNQNGTYLLDDVAVTYPDSKSMVITEQHVEAVEPLGDTVVVSRADLDVVMNQAGTPASLATYPAACQRIRDAIEGADRG